jgi:hypothetical protein
MAPGWSFVSKNHPIEITIKSCRDFFDSTGRIEEK